MTNDESPDSPPPLAASPTHLRLSVVDDAPLGEAWQQYFTRTWPLYRRFLLSEGEAARPSARASREALRTHMPELLGAYDQVCELAGGDPLAARFLSMWCPPPYMAGCSVLVRTSPTPVLVRSYDFDLRYFDGRLPRTDFVRPVIGMQDSAWGLLDGVNADGLAVALAFGGRRVVGTGFGIPLVVRYLLEACATVDEAWGRLRTLPVHMSYSLSLLDRSGAHAVVFVNPDRPAERQERAIVTNHQRGVEWVEHAAFTRSVEREEALRALVDDAECPLGEVLQRFLHAPLHGRQYFRGFGTLYTAAFDVTARSMRVFWPDRQFTVAIDRFEPQVAEVELFRPAGRLLTK